jgi:uncharacterized protein YqhQ
MPEDKQLTIGGQAVIEGVMMRAPAGYAICVRKADGSIVSLVERHVPLVRRRKLLNVPVLRGAISLIEMLVIGFKSLEFSANEAAKDDETASDTKPAGDGAVICDASPTPAADQPVISRAALVMTLLFSIGLGLLLFVVVPNLATHFLAKAGNGNSRPLLEEQWPVTYNIISGFIRILITVGYIWAISLMKDIKRLFQYHGAEHKTVAAFEAGCELNVKNVRPFTKLHPRCGTTFIAIVLLVSIVVFAFFAKALLAAWPGFALLPFPARKAILIVGHILIMPVVAGVCFELLRLGGKYRKNILLRMLIAPGYWFQRLTTREPDDSMIEVAIAALQAARDIGQDAAAAAPAAGDLREAAAG